MSKVRDLIRDSLRKLGAIGQGETVSADEAADGLRSLNQMLSTWSRDGLMIYARVREEFTLTAGVASYSVGPGATFDTTKPLKIIAALSQDLGDLAVETPIRIASVEEFSEISVKDLTSDRPTYLYAEGTHPNETINLWPVPNGQAKLVLYSEKALSSFASINSDVSLPPGYEEAIVYNLAIRLAPEYGKPISGEVASVASSSLEAIMRGNSREHLMSATHGIPAGGCSKFNILTGE